MILYVACSFHASVCVWADQRLHITRGVSPLAQWLREKVEEHLKSDAHSGLVNPGM